MVGCLFYLFNIHAINSWHVIYWKNNMKKDTKKTPTQAADDAAERGKKAIDAGKKANGEQPSDPKVKEKEKKDAEAWRNEG